MKIKPPSIQGGDIFANKIFAGSIRSEAVLGNKFLAVKSAIDNWNPLGLLPDAPDDEFDSESREISEKIDNYKNVSDIAEVVSDVFSRQFYKEGFELENCMDVAKVIYDGLRNLDVVNDV